MDRNREQFKYVVQCRVALRKESVDRNYAATAVDQILPGRSPQGERPVEIWNQADRPIRHVALRKESVDRNTNPGSTTLTFSRSLSARRAWIEILICFGSLAGPSGRSPQGERG